MSKYFAAFLFLISAVNAFAATRVQCGAMKSKYVPGNVGYCAMLPPTYDAKPGKKFPVLYFLHGLGADQSFLASSGASSEIEEAWEEKRLGEFVIITPQAENSCYINSRDGHILYEDFFVKEFVPQMERRFRVIGDRSGQVVSEVSMGRYSCIAVCLWYPRMFVSVAVHMPALLEELPHGSAGAGLGIFLGPAFGSPINERFLEENSPFCVCANSVPQGLKSSLTVATTTIMVLTQSTPASWTDCSPRVTWSMRHIFIRAGITGSLWASIWERPWSFSRGRWD